MKHPCTPNLNYTIQNKYPYEINYSNVTNWIYSYTYICIQYVYDLPQLNYPNIMHIFIHNNMFDLYLLSVACCGGVIGGGRRCHKWANGLNSKCKWISRQESWFRNKYNNGSLVNYSMIDIKALIMFYFHQGKLTSDDSCLLAVGCR